MRTEQEMYDLILETARKDERVRAVILNGSRANPNAPRDLFQDFDVIYIITDVEGLKRERKWIDQFGERMIMQLPDDMSDLPTASGSYAYLMQFKDGNRIDLTLYPVANLGQLPCDSLSVVLLDKDSILEPFDQPSEKDYLPKPPNVKAFLDCCNEFWWVCPYVAKGLWRQEIVYARGMLAVAREQLMKMLDWYIGMKTDFKVNPGKFGKYYGRYLEPELWSLLMKTYADASNDRTWDALFAMVELFRQVARTVADGIKYGYPQRDDERVSGHLEHIRHLPHDAREIY
jgi:aminoglycoside 6-adenylyltransferase